MNRETKYRVWRLDTNTLVAYEFLTEDGWKYKLANNLHGCKWDDAPNYDGVFSPSHFQATYKCRREQYTGLKDKNGTEIYEGDVLQSPYNQDLKYIVVFKEGEFLCENKMFTLGRYNWCNSQVIGNIHQTPELLKS